tara:strand:- start:190 stop:519 length:330 start_codon:yes stop_codon:yes gene_type:complete
MKMDYISYKTISFSAGTHLQGYLTTTRSTIEKAFGEGIRFTEGGETKVSIEWSIAFKTEDDRTINATIYAWKTEGYVPPVDELFKWNVGGHNLDALDCVYQAIEKAKGL